MDRISLKNIKIFAYHGVYSHERINGQEFEIDVDMYLDLHDVADTDNLRDTINYGEVFNLVEEIVTTRRYNLIERLAGSLCWHILKDYEKVQEVTVRIRKPSAPIEGTLDYPEVEVTRGRSK